MKPKTARRFLNRNGHKLVLSNDPRRALLKRAKIARKVLRKGKRNG